MALVLFYVPTPHSEEAEKIATTLLNEKLIACANIMPPHKAIYRNDDQLVQDESEHVMILKTTEDKAKALEQRLNELHLYDCPCIAQIKTSDCNADFLAWAERELT